MHGFALEKTVAESLRLLADRNEVRRHGSVDPAVLPERRVEDTARPGELGLVLRLDVIHRPARSRDYHISLRHGCCNGRWRLDSALCAWRHHDNHRITTHRICLGSEGLPD